MRLFAPSSIAHTFEEARDEAMGVLIHKTAVPRYADGGEDVVAGNHDRTDVRLGQLLEDTGRGRLELVLEDDEAHEVELALSFVPLHLLALDPGKLFQMFGGTSNDSVALVRV